MAEQFDLYRDFDGGLVMIIQSAAVDNLGTRVFASCVPADRQGVTALDRLSVPFIFAEREFRVMLSLLGTARVGRIGTKVGNHTHLRDQITRALDLLYLGV